MVSEAIPSFRAESSWSWKSLAGTLGAIFLGGVLLVAAAAKAVDPAAFAEQVHAEGLDFLLPAKGVAFFALGLEVALGMALLLNLRRLGVLLPAALLVAFFLFLTGRSYWHALHGTGEVPAGCGCFGNLVERTPAEAFWQDLLLLVPPLALAFLGRPSPSGGWPRLRLGLVALGVVAALAFAVKAPDLPLDDFVTRLRPGVQVAAICAGAPGGGEDRVCLDALVPELEEGSHWVILADLNDEAFGQAVASLNESVFQGEGPTLWVVSAATPEEHHTFYWRWGPVFQIREAPPGLLRPLYRRLPRSFRVEEGEVRETVSGLPPFGDAEKEGERAES